MLRKTCKICMTALCACAAAAGCMTMAAAAPVDDAYRAYYDFLQEQVDSIGLPANDVPSSELPQYDFPINLVNEEIGYAQLTDFDQDGIPELVFGKALDATNAIGGGFVNCVYTYQNGKMVRLAGELPIDIEYWGDAGYSYQMTLSSGTDGYVYMVWKIDGSGTDRGGSYYYTLKNGKWQEVAGFTMRFHPDIYISQDVFSSTGEMSYFYTGPDRKTTELPHSTWYARLQAMTSGGEKTYELQNNLNTTLSALAKRIDPKYASHYRTPSSWAVAAVNEGIQRNIVPKPLQKKYAEPITRAEFCSLATSFYEEVSGTEIKERAAFTDTKDKNIEKMGGLGVVTGVGEGRFHPDALLTREQAAVILTNLSRAMGKELSAAMPDFTDHDAISAWALEQVGQVQQAGIMNGVDQGRFAPKDPYTREQSIVTMMRMESGSTVAPTRLELKPEQEEIRASTTTTVHYTVSPENATNKTIASWTSSDTKVATVSGGTVRGISEGTATITATTTNGVSASCKIRVTPQYEMSIAAKHLPKTVNCLYLKDDRWDNQDVDYVPNDPMVTGKLRITEVVPKGTHSSLGVSVLVRGELESINRDLRFDFDPYLKYDLKDERGHIVKSGIEEIFNTLRKAGDTFEVELYFDDQIIDLDSAYTIDFRNDSGRDQADVLADAPEIKLPELPFSVSDQEGNTTTIEEVVADVSYSRYTEGYEVDISFRGTAEVEMFGAKFRWQLCDSSGGVVAEGTDYVSSWNVDEDGSFVLGPHYSGEGIDLQIGESYEIKLSRANA